MAQMTYTIADDVIDEFLEGFLRNCPIPSDFEGSSRDWVKEWGRKQFLQAYRQGKRDLALDEVQVADDLLS